MSRIKILQPEVATGRLKEIYENLEKQRGQIAEVHKIQSLRPESVVIWKLCSANLNLTGQRGK